MRPKALILLGVLLTLVLAPACGPVATPTPARPTPTAAAPPLPSPTPKPPEKVTLTFWNYWDGKNAETIQALTSKYNKEHPNVEVKNVFIGWGELLPKLMTAVAGKEVPDIAAGDMAWIPKLVETGALVELNPYIEKSGVNVNDFYPELLKIDRYDKKFYALPVSTNNLELFYNKDLFKAAGLDPEKPPKTWDELAQMAKKCTDPGKGIWGMELFTQPGEGLTWQFQVYLWQAGGEFLRDGYSKAAFNTLAGKKALQFWVDLIQKDKAAPLAPWGLFGQGKACMVMDGSWMVGIWRKQAPFNFGTAPMPIPAGGQPATNMGGEHIFLFKTTSEKQQAAWEFVNWLTSTETQVEWDTQTGFTPVRDSVAKSETYRKWLMETEPRLVPFVDNQRYAHARPPITKYPDVSDTFSRELEKALHGTVNVDKALANAEAAVNKVLGK